MSTTENADGEEPVVGPGRIESYPQYQLVYDFDDPEAPKKLTLYDEGKQDTRWVTCDAVDAVSLDEVR